MSELLIRNGTVVTAEGQQSADIHVVGERIQAVGPQAAKGVKLPPDQVLDAQGCYVFPGGIDPHTHMELPLKDVTSSDTFESGTLAALHGGTTTILDFANQAPGHSLTEALELWHRKADGNAACDYGFHVSVTGYDERTARELRDCVEGRGVSSFKVFLAYESMRVSDRQLLEIMEQVRGLGGIILVHAENGDLVEHLIAQNRAAGNLSPAFHPLSRPMAAEAEAVSRAVDLSTFVRCPLYIVHLSSEEALARVRTALSVGSYEEHRTPVLVETCPQYLVLEDSVYSRRPEGGTDEFLEAAKYVMSPPLRTKKDQRALWKGLNKGLISVVATDHCPFRLEQKALGRQDFSRIPNGIAGVEHRMELLYSEGVHGRKISLEQFVQLTSAKAARVFGLYPRKGTIAPGSDADLVIFDPTVTHKISAASHHMGCDYSAYEGFQVRGKVRTTILRGTLAVNNGQAQVGKGFGKYLKRGKPQF
jgi:dihydropyrimidinase